jgi:hypothetical protein
MSAQARGVQGVADGRIVALARLAADGLIVGSEQSWRTTRRWQQAMARAAVELYDQGDPGDDLRVPIALAMLGLYSTSVDDETLAELVEAMLPVELASLGLAPLGLVAAGSGAGG